MGRLQQAARRIFLLAVAGGILAGMAAAAVGQGDDEGSAGLSSAPPGKENTTLRVQNVSAATSAVSVDFRRATGASIPASSKLVPSLSSGAAVSFSQADDASLPPPFSGSGVAASNGAIETMVLREVAVSTGVDSPYSWSAYTMSRPSVRLFLPLVYTGLPGPEWWSRITIVNTSAEAGCARLTLRTLDGEETLLAPESEHCPGGGYRVRPRAQVVVTPDDLPEGLLGKQLSGVVDSSPSPSGLLANLSVYVDVFRGDGTRLLGSYEAPSMAAMPNGELLEADAADGVGTKVLVPLVQNEDGWHTTLLVQNASVHHIPVDVAVTFHGLSSGPKTVTFDDVEDVVSLAGLDPARGVPEGAAGWAEVNASAPVAVLLQAGRTGTQDFGLATMTPALSTGKEWRLPLVARNYGPQGDRGGRSSWFRVLVQSGASANVKISLASDLGSDCPTGAQSHTVSVAGAQTFDQGAESATGFETVPDCFQGAAILRSDVPIVVLAGVETDVFSGDTLSLYPGARP